MRRHLKAARDMNNIQSELPQWVIKGVWKLSISIFADVKPLLIWQVIDESADGTPRAAISISTEGVCQTIGAHLTNTDYVGWLYPPSERKMADQRLDMNMLTQILPLLHHVAGSRVEAGLPRRLSKQRHVHILRSMGHEIKVISIWLWHSTFNMGCLLVWDITEASFLLYQCSA